MWYLAVAMAATPLEIAQDELDRAMAQLEQQAEPAHYAAVTITDVTSYDLSYEAGVRYAEVPEQGRFLDVDLRVGTPELDSSHAIRGFSAWSLDTRDRRRVGVGERSELDLRHAIRQEIDLRYREGREAIVLLRSNKSVLAEEEHPAPDWGPGVVGQSAEDTPELVLNIIKGGDLHTTLGQASEILDRDDRVMESTVSIHARREVTYMVDSEGTQRTHGRTRWRIALANNAIDADGEELGAFYAFDSRTPDGAPSADDVIAAAEAVAKELSDQLDAPRGEPWSGPVWLSGRASAVFFHEVFGHRVEGHRQKDDSEGKTFLEYVGRPILPKFLSVYDDPTLLHWDGVELNGHYTIDDEGQPAAVAQLVENGVFQGFLMGRSPLQGFTEGNGHARRSPGSMPTPRMGNTIVATSRGQSEDKLRRAFLAELRRQDKEFGYRVEDIDGGFTMTGRVRPNAFNVRANRVFRVYADGRPDERVRGVDLVGTPLVAFSQVFESGDTPEVFNGVCGAESGWVPVSAVSPALLVRRLELQLKERGDLPPPLLPRPGQDPELGVNP